MSYGCLQDEDTSLALSSHGSNTDLDPLLDSLELEFGYDFTDPGSQRSNVTGQSRRQGTAQPSPLVTTSNRARASSGRSETTQATSGHQVVGTGYSQVFSPPPTYQAAVDGSDGGITAAGGRDGYEWPIDDPPWPLGGSSGGGGSGPKRSSTPLIREGMRRRGQRQRGGDSGQQTTEQATPSEENPLFTPDSGLLQELDTL